MKKVIIFSVLTILNIISIQAEHAILIQNNTTKKIKISIEIPTYYKGFFHKEISVDKDSELTYNFDEAHLNCEYKVFAESKNTNLYDRSSYFRYFSFIDDTMIVKIVNDSIILNSKSGYDKELNYVDSSTIESVSDFSVEFSKFISLQEDYLKNKISDINRINFKSPLMAEYLTENIRFITQNIILQYIIDTSINSDAESFKELSEIYEKIADCNIINNPIFYNNQNYNNLICNFIKYRDYLVDEIPFKAFRKSKRNDVFFNNLNDFSRQVIEVNQLYLKYYYHLDKRNNYDDVLKEINNITKDTHYIPQIKQDLLYLLKIEASVAENKKFPVLDFTGLDGNIVRLNDYIGNVVIVCFYRFGCMGDFQYLRYFHEIEQTVDDENLKFLFINTNDNLETWSNGIQKNDMSHYINLYIGGGYIDANIYAQQLGVWKKPYTIIIDGEGNNYEYNSYVQRTKLFKMKIKTLLLINKIQKH